MMTAEKIVQLFLRSLNLLTVVDNRVQLGPLRWTDIETITRLCFAVESINHAEDTPAQAALVRLACTCVAALTTVVVDADDNADIIREWTPPPASIVVSIRPDTR
jgi:hypothetical protein